MTAFNYRALTREGKTSKGLVEADSPRQARTLLRDRGLMPTLVEEVGRGQTGSGLTFRLERQLAGRDVALFTRQLATLLDSGLPLEEALYAITRQTDNARLKSIVLSVRGRILEGHNLASALSEYPRSFSELYRAMVTAGEESGHLNEVLLRLAEYGERLQVIRGKMQVALIYPVILTLVAIGVIALLMTYVVPKVVEQFTYAEQTLPLLTRILIVISDGLQQWGAVILAALVGMALFCYWWLSNTKRRSAWHRLQMKLPVIRTFVNGQQSLQFARTLAILVGSGLDLLQGLKVAAGPMTNLYLKQAVKKASRLVREGCSLSRALEQSGPFPPLLVYMIANGEQSGELERMLEKAAEAQETEFETRISWLLGLFEPVLILVMGVIVLGIVLAILLPILELNNLTAL
ncbi:type II secretion system inner membrane protein GspF [Marinobacterium stanieri]|uniref:General secretion pathway protein F n=1 Tax=Marinobacterium stanieri TaxID=49186 RepID=A0A1N6XJB6_9GAMM|nr:type II secretion system inner membrane protein GspF [Marinobacterium stanieri]SIR02329.1 general secretion pathway protein F [Marinobacterium stanieri]